MKGWKGIAACLLLCSLYLLLGLILLPLAGVQYDEVLFTSAIYPPIKVEHAMKFGTTQVPIMLLPYLGTLKACIYAPLLAITGPSLASLRMPPLLFGTLSLVFFFFALRRLVGGRMALGATALLATDLSYLATTVFDWGPVALQHVLVCGALYSGARFAQERRVQWLGICGFALGLALWDKATHLWILGGFGLAFVIVFRRVVWDVFRDKRTLAVMAGSFVLGALPFLYYNKIHPFRTFTSQAHVASDDLKQKLIVMDRTLGGSALFGFIVRDEDAPLRNLAGLEGAVIAVDEILHRPRWSLQHALILIAFLGVPFLWRSPNGKTAAWLALGTVLAASIMLVTRNAGGSVHHQILLWPMPHFLLGLVATHAAYNAGLRLRWIPVALLACAVMTNIAVTNAFAAQLIRSGPTVAWSDATRSLMQRVGSFRDRHVFGVEWGILEQFRFYGQGRVSILYGSDSWIPQTEGEAASPELVEYVARPDVLFVAHTIGNEISPGKKLRLERFAASHGYRKQLIDVVHDRHGRAIFELFSFTK